MRKLLVFMIALSIALIFVSCKTATKATPETSKSESLAAPASARAWHRPDSQPPTKPAKPASTAMTSAAVGPLDLNGKWKMIGEWEIPYEGIGGKFDLKYEIVHKGTEIIMITQSGEKIACTLKGNVIHLEAREAYNPHTGVTSFFPAREFKVSQDGNTLTSEFDYTWDDGRDRGPGSMKLKMTRE